MAFALRAFLTALASLGVLAYPAWLWGKQDGVLALGVAIAVCFVGALVGHLPHHFFRGRDEDVANATMAGFGLRMLTTGAIAFAIASMSSLPRTQFMIWVAVVYLVFLVLEVMVMTRQLSARENTAATSESTVPVSRGSGEQSA